MPYTTVNDPSAHFQTTLWTGNASNRSITNDGNSDIQPDWVWIKKRSAVQNHTMTDSSRGLGNILFPDVTDAESATQLVTSFDSDGFSLNTNALANDNSATYVGWQWKCNGGTTTSFSASGAQLAGNRQTNATAGLSIITYTGDGNNNATIPHGLSSPPKFVIIKERGNATNWYVGHDFTFTTGEVFFNTNAALQAAFGPFNKTAPDASNITLGTDGSVNGNNDTYVCYAFADVQGYSKFGAYVGNGKSDGPYVHLGFQPAFVIIRRIANNDDWFMVDNTREVSNPRGIKFTYVNQNAAEVTSDKDLDFLSHGFKCRTVTGFHNDPGNQYIYMAWAQHPFVTSTGVPSTAI